MAWIFTVWVPLVTVITELSKEEATVTRQCSVQHERQRGERVRVHPCWSEIMLPSFCHWYVMVGELRFPVPETSQRRLKPVSPADRGLTLLLGVTWALTTTRGKNTLHSLPHSMYILYHKDNLLFTVIVKCQCAHATSCRHDCSVHRIQLGDSRLISWPSHTNRTHQTVDCPSSVGTRRSDADRDRRLSS